MECQERAEWLPATGLEHRVGERRGRWLEETVAGGREVPTGSSGEELLEEDVTLMGCLPLQPGAQLAGSEARGGTDEVRGIGLQVADAGEGVQPGADGLFLTREAHGAEGALP
jgi:hypothetical protein